jgi:2-polyprenyl-3-methyl-5-hydroxy-6-metoxy-1,4-benzoquinol methylase
MPETVNHCPLCDSSKSNPFDSRDFHGQPVENRICDNCGLVFQSPRMTDEELEAYYEREYRQTYQGQEGPDLKDLAVQKARAESLLDFVRPHISALSTHLDIGCSAGLLLEAFHNQYDCQPVGIEPSRAYREYAQALGLKVFSSLEVLERSRQTSENPEPALSINNFDLISMAHVLEHLPNPVTYLRSLRDELLASSGWLLIEVPNLYCHDSFEIAHLVSYSTRTLAQTLEMAGYTIRTSIAHGKPRSELLPLYLTVLARPSAQIIREHPQRESGVKRKRQLGLHRRRITTRLFPLQAWKPIADEFHGG